MLYRAMQLHPPKNNRLKDVLGVAGFVAAVLIGAWLINLFIFRSFNVDGPSMQDTLHTGDRLIVNRVPVTWAHLQNKSFVPERGTVIVFKNPMFETGMKDEFLVKRVLAFPGERVTVKDGVLRVYNAEHPDGFEVDKQYPGPLQPTDGDQDMTVPEHAVYVAGDHRQPGYSYDSRNGLGTVPYENIIGPVGLRIYPFTQFKFF